MLNSLRIIEVEGLGPGPFAAMMFADLGADVITIHRKGSATTPGMPEASLLDRGKRSIDLDLKDPEDILVFQALIASADGLIEGFRPGVMERLGIGPDACHRLNPALVYGRMTGWGQDSVLSHAAGHDLNYLSLSGALWYASSPGDAPVSPATLVGDIGGGAMYLVTGMLAAILKARETGHGEVVDAAIYDGSAHMMNLLMSLRQTDNMPDQRGQGLLDGAHWCTSYGTSDGGFMSVQCLEPKFYALFLDILGLSQDPAFQDQYDRAAWPELHRRLAGIFATQTRDHWAGLFEGTDACVAPVLSPSEARAYPMNKRNTWVDLQGNLQAAPAPRFQNAPLPTPAPPPLRGSNRDEILTELGLTAKDR